jgi:murein L,D-transpeptidase YcbB/YkuD
MASEQKQRYFEEVRRKLLSAQYNRRQDEEQEAEVELMRMFETRDEYEHVMKLYEEYEQDERNYHEYLEALEEESMNYERLEMARNLERKRRLYEEVFGEDQ